jgi:hypothetical protein
MPEITDAEGSKVLWASSEQGKAAVRAAFDKAYELGLKPAVTDIGAIVWAAHHAEQAAGTDAPWTAERILRIGPAPAGPLMCFHCATNTCSHSRNVKQSSVHGGGLVPAMTAYNGTALCLDCATRATEGGQ